MKTKKQQAAAAAAASAVAGAPPTTATPSEKKPVATSAAATSTASTSATPTPSGSTQATALKKPLKRLQLKAKDSPSPKATTQEATSSGTAVVTTKPKPAPKSTPKNEVKSKKVTIAAGGKKTPAAAAAPKKIQKELKNLGITDRAINQIDTATVECNPSISEMVKTKSRATVSQLKYSDLGGGPPAKPVAPAGSSEVQKPVEPPAVVSTAIPSKKRPPPKTKDDSPKQDVAREEAAGGAKNKTPVTAQATPSNPATNPAVTATTKEDVKAGPSNGGAKSKAKRPESKNDNDGQQGGVATEQKSSPARKNPTVAAAKPKPKTKKAALEEQKKAAEVVAAVATAEVEQASVVQEVAVPAKQRTPPIDEKHDEEKPCSLELDQDDKNESDVQSRIEDIMKALEESDGEDEGPPVPMLLPPTSSKPAVEVQEPKVDVVQQVVDQDQEKKQTKVAAKPKVAASKKKAPVKKKVGDDAPAIDPSKQESPTNKSEDDKSIKKTPSSQAKRKYVRKPSGGQASKSKVDPKKLLEPVGTDEPKVDPTPETPVQESQKPEQVPDVPTPPEEPTESPDPPKTIRSSTDNDDDVPLNRLKDKTSPKPLESTPEAGFTVPNAPLLAALLAPSPATTPKSKRKYVRKPSTTPTSGGKKKPSSKSTSSADAKDKKPEKPKDVYDFDDSDSENDAPVKAGKPVFKTNRKPLETSSAKEDEEEDAEEVPQAEASSETPDPLESKSEQDPLKESDSEEEFKKPAKKPTKSRNNTPKEPSSEEESEEDDKDADPDERPQTPMSKKIKREVRDSSEESNGDSDSSEESVRTRIVKKHLTAKTRHLKLYGFWSGPKRHRVASLNAIAKVHCLYENETRAALEASLMKQGPPRPRAGTSKEVKKEKIEEGEKKDECKEENKAEKKEESEVKGKQKEEKGTKEEPKKKVVKKTEPKEVKKKETKKVVVKDEKKEEKKEDKKKAAEKQRQASESDTESEESSEEEVVTRTLRCVPGLRGAGKHWDPNASSMESEGDVLPDSDETYAQGKDTDPVKKRKVKRKVVKKAKPKPKSEKADKPKPPVKKIKKEVKALQSDNDKKSEDESDESGSESEKAEAASPKPKAEDVKKRKRAPKEKKEIVESLLGKKRMASLNATAMLAATYEVQRILYRNTDSDSDSPAEKPKAKKVKETKEQKEAAKAEAKKEAKEQKELKEQGENAAEVSKAAEKERVKEQKEKEKEKEKEKAKEREKEKEKEPLITVKTEPNRERREEHEVKREIEEPRPVSSNLVIAQDTEVTITGVYVNSSLGANQEAYCKMQYRVQQSVTEERLVRPGEAPPKSYTPLTALSSMRPPNDQTLATPPLFGPPSQCDSPLGLGPRAFYPPPTSSSGSSSAFCAPIPHGSPGYYQPAGPLISPHLLAQPIPISQHGPGSSSSSSTITKQPPESDSPGVSSLVQPPSSSTADSTDSDVLLTAGDLSSRSQQAAAAAAAAAYRYGPSGPPNLYPRPMQMHCPPPHLAPNYYAAPPYSQYPPEMYYTHAAYPPAHFYPKFAQYYPPSRRYYPAPVAGEHMYEQPPPPPSAGGPVPPPAGAQLVPAGPPQGPPPQHLEHYPGPQPYPYPGYGSPGPGPGGQCYSRNAYMDAHYTTNCPCPMQSCPKNVNAGSLIGIKASKGPVTTTATPIPHHIASSASASSNNSSTAAVQMSPSSSSTCTTMACSTEPIVISSGSSTSSSPPPLDIHSPIVASSEPVVTTTVATVTTTAPTTTEPNTSPKVKPESDLHQYNSYHYHYPHRPSAPPPTHPLHSSYIPVGVVEVKQEPVAPTLEPTADSKTTKNIPKLLPLVVKQEITEVKQEPQPVTMTVVSCKKEDFEENGPAMTPDLLLDEALIKKEALVSELVHHQLDDKRILSDILTAEANLITVDSILPEIPASTVKRRPLLVACKKSTPKKSPPNSYKNLIKRTNLSGDEGGEATTAEAGEEPTITVLSDDDDELEEDDDEVVVTSTPVSRKPKRTAGKPRKLLKRTRRVFGAEQLRHLQTLNRSVLKSKRVRRLVKRPSCVPRNPAVPEAAIAVKEPEPTPVEPVEVQELREEPPRPMSNVDLTIDLVAKGYFSEPEFAEQAKSRSVKRLKQQEGRSQSEQHRGSSKKAKQQLDDPLDMTEPPNGKSAKKAKKRAAPKPSKQNGKKRATSTPLPPEVVEDQPEVNPPLDVSAIDVEPTAAAVDDRETDFDDAATMLVDDDMMSVDTNTMINRHNNNNNSAVENKNAAGTDPLLEEDPLTVEPTTTCVTNAELSTQVEDRLPLPTEVAVFEEDDEDDEEEEIMLARRFAKKSGGLKSRTSRSRSKSKSRKFSIKKRHRPTRVPEVEEIIVPRKSNSVPRWSNGWTWEGQPFQGKVFLNSDDPPVTRTCYPAMRHSEGDIIRPRDSVLLRAGSKRAELPYVAKVAHLWENPEDGEMMMSLLWYYRPEHTEQGRQPVDGPDEVFASRHKDHNSVACIEDKCYVLTFSEYCRFRRQLRGFEENIDEQPSIVPPLRRENPRLPPSIVSPELVMYCQRVYEFRLKRLLKQPS
ncbi:titin-like isoform X2 [Culex pipiens pallens]|uniref:titin-like isoform X2 n=1 Tax=Culex pipiens pallens TaxID=42434 RepID=UPI0019545A13|nr:titin-like isoform X2 [Culex pipiens pallens]